MLTNIPDILLQVLGNISSAAAIIDQDGLVLYANAAFEKKFFVGGSIKGCTLLHALPAKLKSWGKADSPQEVGLPTPEDTTTLLVYLINKFKKGDNRFLLMIKPDETTADIDPPRLSDVLADNGRRKKEQTEKLSPEFAALIGDDEQFKSALLVAQKAARSDLPVLIIGESGTGKEILARAIHRTSRRSQQTLVDVNCAAIPDTLIESELFGYERGAFTGARADGRSGYFDAAHKGTILLDEIGDASLQSQSKLLRVLEDGCFKRVGGNRNVSVDVRLISSTNQDLKKMIAEKAFREDLFYRINTFTLQLPPLKDRVKDIPLLVNHFLASSSVREHRSMQFLSSAMEILKNYHWPGNIRELKGVVSYAVNMTSTSLISADSLPSFLLSHPLSAPNPGEVTPVMATSPLSDHLSTVLQEVERELIKEAMEKSGNKSEAIRKLGISRRTFYIKIKQYGLC